jgi:hypothetical protein
MRDTIDMASEVLDRMPADSYCREPYWTATDDELKEFEALVRADEREACAKLCDEESSSLGGVAEGPFVTDFGKHTHMSMAAGAQNCAAAIRARGETK